MEWYKTSIENFLLPIQIILVLLKIIFSLEIQAQILKFAELYQETGESSVNNDGHLHTVISCILLHLSYCFLCTYCSESKCHVHIIHKYGEIGSPCLHSLPGLKYSDTIPFCTIHELIFLLKKTSCQIDLPKLKKFRHWNIHMKVPNTSNNS